MTISEQALANTQSVRTNSTPVTSRFQDVDRRFYSSTVLLHLEQLADAVLLYVSLGVLPWVQHIWCRYLTHGNFPSLSLLLSLPLEVRVP